MKKVLGLLMFVLLVGTMFSCKDDEKSPLKDITDFKITIEGVAASDIKYAVTGKNIGISVPYRTSLDEVTPIISISDKATVFPLSGQPLSFTNGVAKEFVVTAEDKSTQSYNVTISTRADERSAQNDITDFKIEIEGTQADAIRYSDVADNTFKMTVPYDADLSKVKTMITISDKATVTPASGEVMAFEEGVAKSFVVTAENETTQTFFAIITKREDPRSKANDITDFKIAIDGVNAGDIKYEYLENAINITVPFGTTDLSNVIPTIMVSDSATVSPVSGEVIAFEDGVSKDFVVSAENGSTKVYEVTVICGGEMGSGVRLSKFKYDESALSGIKEEFIYSYNDASLVSNYTQKVEDVFSGSTATVAYIVSYDKKNQVTQITAKGTKDVVSTFTYNTEGLIIASESMIDGVRKYSYSYSYDDNKNLSKVVRIDLDETDETKAAYIQTFKVDENGNTLTHSQGTQEFEATFDDKPNPFKGIWPAAYGKILMGNGAGDVNTNNPTNRTGADNGISNEYNGAGYVKNSTYTVFGFATVSFEYTYE